MPSVEERAAVRQPGAMGAEGAAAACGCGTGRDAAADFDYAAKDRPTEKCAVFGMFAPGSDVARMACYGLQSLQHRGQESCGIAVVRPDGISAVKGSGLVASVFSDDSFAELVGDVAVGHCRYSTSGGDGEGALVQPFVVGSGADAFAFAHNGTLINTSYLETLLAARGVDTTGMNDSRMSAELLGCYRADGLDMMAAIRVLMTQIQGAYSMIVGTADALYAFRDPNGIRPFEVGILPERRGWAVASETCGLDIIGAEFLSTVGAGEIVRLSAAGVESFPGCPPHKRALCVFEYVYFARPDSVIEGCTVYEARRRMGMQLAIEAPADVDLVVGVPDSGVPPAMAYAQELGIPYVDGIVKNRYIGRTFIQPTQELRQLGLLLKLNPLKSVIAGKRIAVIDDSIVRGTTSKALVAMLRNAGAKEVHLRIVSPETRWPCFFGIDIATQDQLLCAKMSTPDACKWIGADSLQFLSVPGLRKAVGQAALLSGGSPKAAPACGGFCDACFSGKYPFVLTKELKESSFLPENL